MARLLFLGDAFFRMKGGAVIYQRNLVDRQPENLPDLLDRELANANEMFHFVKFVASSLSRKPVPSAKPLRIPEYRHIMHCDNLWDRRRGEREQISSRVVKIRRDFP